MALGDILRKKHARIKNNRPPGIEVVNQAMIPEVHPVEPAPAPVPAPAPAPVRKRGRPRKKHPNNEDIHITCNEQDLIKFHTLRLSLGPKTTHIELLRKLMDVYETYKDVEEIPVNSSGK